LGGFVGHAGGSDEIGEAGKRRERDARFI